MINPRHQVAVASHLRKCPVVHRAKRFPSLHDDVAVSAVVTSRCGVGLIRKRQCAPEPSTRFAYSTLPFVTINTCSRIGLWLTQRTALDPYAQGRPDRASHCGRASGEFGLRTYGCCTRNGMGVRRAEDDGAR